MEAQNKFSKGKLRLLLQITPKRQEVLFQLNQVAKRNVTYPFFQGCMRGAGPVTVSYDSTTLQFQCSCLNRHNVVKQSKAPCDKHSKKSCIANTDQVQFI